MKTNYCREENTIGSRIRACRKEMGYSQETLAAMLYMKKNTICQYEKDLRDIPSSTIIGLAKALNTTPNYLLLGNSQEEGWMDDMIGLMQKINKPELRRMALEQLRCVLSVNESFETLFISSQIVNQSSREGGCLSRISPII